MPFSASVFLGLDEEEQFSANAFLDEPEIFSASEFLAAPEPILDQPNQYLDAAKYGANRLMANISGIPAVAYETLGLPLTLAGRALDRPELTVRAPEFLTRPSEFRRETGERYKYTDIDFKQAIQSKDPKIIASHVAKEVIANAPHQAVAIASYLAGGPVLGAAAMGLPTAADEFMEGRKAGADPVANVVNAITSGAIEVGTEMMGTFNILKRATSSLAKSYGTKGTVGIMRDVGKAIINSMGQEGFEEVLAESGQNLSRYATGVDPNALRDFWWKASGAGVTGAVSGGVMTGPAAALAAPVSPAPQPILKPPPPPLPAPEEGFEAGEEALARGLPPEEARAIAQKRALLPPAQPEIVEPPPQPIIEKPPVKPLLKPVEPMVERPAPPPLRPQPVEKVAPLPIRPPRKGWVNDPGHIPGEPVLYFKPPKGDFTKAKAAITEIIDKATNDVLYEATDAKGRSLGIWSTVEEATEGAEKRLAVTKVPRPILKPTEAVPRVEPAPIEPTEEEFPERELEERVLPEEPEFVHPAIKDRSLVRPMIRELEEGEVRPGGIVRHGVAQVAVDDAPVIGRIGRVSTHPQWFKDMYAGTGIGSAQVITALEKYEKNEPLTERQQQIVDLVFEYDYRADESLEIEREEVEDRELEERAARAEPTEVVGEPRPEFREEALLPGITTKRGLLKRMLGKVSPPVEALLPEEMERMKKALGPESEVAFKPGQREAGKAEILGPSTSSRLIGESPVAVKYKEEGFTVMPDQVISSPADIAFAFKHLKNEAVENILIGAVKNGRIVAIELIALGNIDQVPIRIIETVNILEEKEADSYFLVHNHPSGYVKPSKEDISLTMTSKEILEKRGKKFIGHVIIDDLSFGFIDPETMRTQEFLHKEYAKTKQIPVLRKYLKWTETKTGVPLASPEAIYEIAKGIQVGDKEGLVFLLNTQNEILNVVVIPHSPPNSQATDELIIGLAAKYHSPSVATVNIARNDTARMRGRFARAGLDYIDNVEVSAGGYRSDRQSSFMEKPVRYEVEEEKKDYLREPKIVKEDTLGSIPKELYDKAKQINKPGMVASAKAATKNILAGIGEAADEFIGTISTRLRNIDPSLKRALRYFEYQMRQRTMADKNAVADMIRKSKKMTPDDYVEFDLARKNGDNKKIMALAEKYDINIFTVRNVLNKIHERARKVGFDIGYLKYYFPRVVKDKAGFLAHFKHDATTWSMLDAAIRDKEGALNRTLTDDEKVNLINSMIRGYSRSKISLSHTANMQSRMIDYVDAELNQYYFDSDSALILYLERVNEAIEARRFFGRGGKTGKMLFPELEYNNLEDSIGSYTESLRLEGRITPEQEFELRKLLQARFGYMPSGSGTGFQRVVPLIKNVTYMTTITNIISAVTQLEDFSIAFYRSAIDAPGSFMKAALGKSKIKLTDVGIEDIWEELREARKSSATLKKLLVAAGFSYMDKVGKETLINTVVDKYRQQAKAPEKGDFMTRLEDIFGDEASQVIEDLKGEEFTDNILYLAFNELLDVQPVALSELPQKYLENPGGRVFYTLKTFTIKRLDYLRNEIINEIKQPGMKHKVQGVKKAVHLMSILMFFGAGVDELKDFILGRETSWSDRLIDVLLRPFGISKYFLYLARRKGIAAAALQYFLLPPTSAVDAIWKDVTINLPKGRKLELIASIPIVGKPYYWRFGRGQEKSKRRILREKPRTFKKILKEFVFGGRE